MKTLLKTLLLSMLLLTLSANAANRDKGVTELAWDNPATNTDVTSIVATCGTQSASSTDLTQLQPGKPGTMLLSNIIKVDGTYTCTVRLANANGNSDPSNATVPITRSAGVFTIVVVVPDQPTNLRVQ